MLEFADIKAIRDFKSLVKYLRTNLGWPVDEENAEDLTFEYSADELGLDEKAAVKIRQIKQLRPLIGNQPWGIFWIDFEPKRLPVVVMRRVLAALVMNKRGSKEDRRPAWNLRDLMFISATGEGQEREISFAHFRQESGDLPTLRVLGWDGGDTLLKLEHIADTLEKHLRWPDDPYDQDAWREEWSGIFRHQLGHVIRTADVLADQLAHLARSIRDAAFTLIQHESENGPLRRLHKAFQVALIHDLNEQDFADTYAQTITYGLLTAAISRTDMSGGQYGTALVAGNVTDMVPITNPFLREILQTFLQAGGRKDGINFDELGIQEVVELLRSEDTDLPAILRDFGNRSPGEDPVIHFYEHFLSAYNKKLKIQRGVFYTPKPVVSYIVRRVHELLQTEFGIEDGLASTISWAEIAERNPKIKIPENILPASPFVQILDPATGTATFLVEVIDVIFNTLSAKWKQQRLSVAQQKFAWNEYVPQYLLPRLYGYELMMAPYAIAHMKIGLKLYETGYHFISGERVRVYLTNTLEEPSPLAEQSAASLFEALGHEAQAVNNVKCNNNFTVVIGNPPYSKSSANQGKWIENLMEHYKTTVRTNETQIQALSDDYAKFLRFAHWRIQQTGYGIIAMITNNGYIDGPLFRDMRNALCEQFQKIFILNLHGDSRKKEVSPNGIADKNVFDIQQGVCITGMALLPRKYEKSVYYADLWGSRELKYEELLLSDMSKLSWSQLNPTLPNMLFIPMNTSIEAEWNTACHLFDIFGTGNKKKDDHVRYGAGFVTQQDEFAISFDPTSLYQHIAELLDKNTTEENLRVKYNLCSTNQWSFTRARKELPKIDLKKITRYCAYRPFDFRYTLFNRNVCTILRERIMSQMEEPNLALLTTRRVTRLPYNNIFTTDKVVEYKIASHDRNTIVFPLYYYASTSANHAKMFFSKDKRKPNLSSQFIAEIEKQLGLKFVPDGIGNLKTSFDPENTFHYLYAVFNSPAYRQRYGEYLKIDFPRLPLTANLDLFQALCRFGGQLVSLHLLEAPILAKPISRYSGRGDHSVQSGFPKYETGVVLINSAQVFEGVPQDVWDFYIGGYQVCYKWLKDRRGRQLSQEEIAHYQKIVVAINETIRLMGEIDEVIEEHGGWPIQ